MNAIENAVDIVPKNAQQPPFAFEPDHLAIIDPESVGVVEIIYDVYLPVVLQSPTATAEGINGRVTYSGKRVGRYDLVMDYFNGAEWVDGGTATTNARFKANTIFPTCPH